MEDFEKNRVEYVGRLETQVAQMQHDLAIYRPLAEKWEPQFESKLNDLGNVGEITLKFGGKLQTLTLSSSHLTTTDISGLVSACAEAFAQELIAAQIKKQIEPHIVKLKAGVTAVNNTNNW